MMPRSDASPPKTQAPHERIRTTAKAKETDLKKVMVRLRYSGSVEKMANLLETWVPFFSCKKTFCTGIRRASNSAGKISDLRWLCHAVLQKISRIKATKALNPVDFCVLILRFQPPKERSFWMIEWLLLSCLGCTIRIVNQPFSIGDLEP